jgi:hypothetical protein
MKVPKCRSANEINGKNVNLGWYWVQVLISSELTRNFCMKKSDILSCYRNIWRAIWRAKYYGVPNRSKLLGGFAGEPVGDKR